MKPSLPPVFSADGTPEWGTLTPGDDLIQATPEGITVVLDGGAGGIHHLPRDRADRLTHSITAALRHPSPDPVAGQ